MTHDSAKREATAAQVLPVSDSATEMRKRHKLGVVIMLISAVVFSTAGLFTKGVYADAWSVIFWRGLFAALFTFGYIILKGRFTEEVTEMGWSGLAVVLVGASGTMAFIPAFKLTTIANVSLIYASAPLCASAVAWLWFREKLELRTLIGALAAFSGIGVIVGNSLGHLNLRGDLLAIWMTLMMSTVMVVYRRYPHTPAAGPAALSSVVLLVPALYFSSPFSVPLHEFGILAAFGLIFALASVTLSEGARRLPPGEAALISTLETPLAIIWAALLFAEVPGWLPILGGTIVMIAVAMTQILPVWSRTKDGMALYPRRAEAARNSPAG